MRTGGGGLAPPGRDAILAVAATFAVNGLLFSSLLPRYPQVVAATDASAPAFGLALVGAGVGGLVGGVAVPALAARLGLVRVVTGAGVVLALAVVGVASSRSVSALAGLLAVAGAADAVHDVAMNEVALGEQSRRRGSVMGRLHGMWSLGSTVGTGAGALMAGAGVPLAVHLGVVAVLAATVQLVAASRLRDRPAADVGPTAPAPPDPALAPAAPVRAHVGPRLRPIAVLAAVTVAAIAAEATPLDWSALMLRRDVGASPGLAGTGPLVFSGGLLLGRAVVDAAVDRVGAGRVVRWGNAVAAVAVASGLVATSGLGVAWPALAGLGVAGVGVSANFPLLFGAGDAVADRLRMPDGTGTSIVGTLPRLGGLVLPGTIGVLAGAYGLVAAVGVTAVAALVVAVVLPPLLLPPRPRG